MKELLTTVSEHAIVLIDALALIAVLIGTIETLIGVARSIKLSSPGDQVMRDVWLRYGRWLIAALTFQLAADIIETSITTSWDAVGRIGAVAAIRTFLNYFLERDLSEVRNRQQEAVPPQM